ncbi:gamma-glutamyltransferase [Hamiltosporidium tvaerminnensis]|uniref:Glutathione hydrolase n=1 Tax=Hamiltosporidium tvaerminnensis TaxID=1176355 RepID=A0A4V6MVA8_9MICR|nr:hypothetical protein LUQ84_000862 [Hamiltosporidium tvaerminnensis]TBU00882.1 gamma-glutamyltransferase [Hamiltosporidium tvaerminnensis]TBU13575.1 gamma-glutamyltransferase [Hamiltosporidium tvaerminnensis]
MTKNFMFKFLLFYLYIEIIIEAAPLKSKKINLVSSANGLLEKETYKKTRNHDSSSDNGELTDDKELSNIRFESGVVDRASNSLDDISTNEKNDKKGNIKTLSDKTAEAELKQEDVLEENPVKGDVLKPRCIDNKVYFPGGNTHEDICFTSAAVSTEVPESSEIGVKILKMGGNAVDAVVASTICVGIVNSFSSGIGGGGFMLIRIPDESKENGNFTMIDFRETAPGALNTNLFKDKHDHIKSGGLAVGVPGEIAGLYLAHQKYGKLKWKDLFTENINIAKKFRVSRQLRIRIENFKQQIFSDPGLSEIYTKNGKLVEEGDFISRMNYAKTLEKIAKDPLSFYNGEIADKIVKSISDKGGVMKKEDLTKYKAIEREVLAGKYREYDIYTTSLPTSGLSIIEAMNILEHFDIKEIKEDSEKNKSYLHYHLLIEIFKFISARRGEFADPDFMKDPKKLVAEIISKGYVKKIVDLIRFDGVLKDKEYRYGSPTVEDHGTTHLNVIDSDEMLVLLTSTINLEFGAKFMDKETGIIFNDQMDDFYVPNILNSFDLGNMPSNILEPYKRPFSSASPVILMKYNEILMLGAAGGTRIPTSIILVIFHLLLNKRLSDAIMEPRIHHQLFPSKTFVEDTFPIEIRDYLRNLGQVIEVSRQNSIFTSVQGIHMIKNKDGEKIIQAFSDKRKGGESAGY